MSYTQYNTAEGKSSTVFRRFFTLSIHACIVMGSVLLFAVVVFLIFFKSTSVVSVPSMVGKSFVDAAILLQEKELHPFVSLQYTDDPLDKGIVIQQDVAAGTAVRAKRIIGLTVSQGTVIAEVPDYRELRYDEVARGIKAQSSGVDALLTIVGVQKVFQAIPARVIVAQKPAPGTKITGKNTAISFVISRGEPTFESFMPDVLGLYFYELYEMMESVVARFDFYISDRDVTLVTETMENRKSGIIIGQDPAAGKAVSSNNARFRIGIRARSHLEDEVKDISHVVVDVLKIGLPVYDNPVKLVIRMRPADSDEVRTVVSFLTRGGVVSLPYFVTAGTLYEAEANGEIVWRYTVPQ